MTNKGPGQHPDPPANLAQRELPLVEIGEPLWRIFQNRYDNPLFFGQQATQRFDDPSHTFGICYCARDEHGAVVETFGHSAGVNLVTQKALDARSLLKISLERTLEVVDLTGPGLKVIGADSRLTSGGDYGTSQRWSLALHEHPWEVDGILYRARNDPDRLSVAVYSRAAGLLEVAREWKFASTAGMERILPVIEHYGFGIG